MKKRILYLELIRMLAIFFVVMNHTGYSGQLYYLAVHEQPVHWLYMGLSALHKAAVPLFFMCSGALLLDKEESLKTLFTKRVLRFALVLFLFSMLAYLYDLYREGGSFDFKYFLYRLYSYRFVDAYWYLYNYLGYLLVLPLLRRLARAMTDREFWYLPALWLVLKTLELLPIWMIDENLDREEHFVLFLTQYPVFFPLMGYYIEKRMPARVFNRKNAAIAALAALLSLTVMCLSTERWCRLNDDWPAVAGELYFGALNFVVALAIFFQAKTLFLRRSPGPLTAKLLTLFGSCSFGVYLLQHYFLAWTKPLFQTLEPYLGTYPACLVWCLCICLIGTAAAWLMKQVPGLKKLI